MNIRMARVEDAPAVAALVTQLGYDSTPQDVEGRLRRLLARRDQRFVVAEADSRLLGWVHVELAWSSTTRTPAHRFYEELGYAQMKTQYSFVKPLGPGGADMAGRLVPSVDPETP